MFAAAMDASAIIMSVFSPTKTCRVRVSGSRYRYDPYRARVMPAAFNPCLAAPTMAAPRSPVRYFAAPEAIAALTKPLAVSPKKQHKKSMADVVATARPTEQIAAKPAAAPKAAAASAPTTLAAKPQEHWALVGFKHEAVMFQAPFRVAVGDVVIVEADRGEHIGVIQSITTTAPSYNVPSKILRHASTSEFNQIDELTEKEAKIAATAQRYADNAGLSCKVFDTEMQMDGSKLTIFFSSKVFVDFRKLQRVLFREFRCRIWLAYMHEVCTYTPVRVNAPAF